MAKKKKEDQEFLEQVAMKGHLRWWGEKIDYGIDNKPFKTVYCMKPPRNKKSLHFLQGNEIYNGKQWGIDGCLMCEARVRLDCTIYAERYVAHAKLHPEARMRCDWFRKWASDYPASLLIMLNAYDQRVKEWREIGKRRAEWLQRHLYRYVYFEGEKVICPFCNMPWKALPGDIDSISYQNSFSDWPALARHINEYHGLVRVIKRGKRRGRTAWYIRYNGDEPYDYELPDLSIDAVDLGELIEESRPIKIKKPKFKKLKIGDDLKSLL